MAARYAANQVVIALGTNVGDRGRTAWWALQQLLKNDIQVQRCSGLYESAPAYVTDQPAFLNAAVLATTSLQPRSLLSTLKDIEVAAGRDVVSGPRWGPRPLDLDIIFMSGQPSKDDILQIPHPRWHERDFVVQPVSDLWCDKDISATSQLLSNSHSHSNSHDSCHNQGHHSQDTKQMSDVGSAAAVHSDVLGSIHTAHERLSHRRASTQHHATHMHYSAQQGIAGAGTAPSRVQETTRSVVAPENGSADRVTESQSKPGDIMRRVTPIHRGQRMITWGQKTLLMSIMNITPDSFSDGGSFISQPSHSHSATSVSQASRDEATAVNLDAVVNRAKQMVADGTDILDVGGQSTRPGATMLSSQQELARIMQVIRALRACPDLDDVLISVDTFHADVAREAVLAGADIVNDVSGGTLDPGMYSQVAALGVPYIQMHMRGDPTNMQSSQNTQYTGPIWQVVGQEMMAVIDKAVAAGIPAWNIITDPGLGFAKKAEHSLQLMRDLPLLRHHGLQGAFRHGPMLVGPSRKGFLGKLTGRTTAHERDAATVAAAVACVEKGADILRVHNTRDVRDGLKVADAMYQNR